MRRIMKYFDNQFLFSETYLKSYVQEIKKKLVTKDEDLNNIVKNIVEWNKEYTIGDLKDDPWTQYIDALLDVLGFQNKEKKESIRILHTNPINISSGPVATCYCIGKEDDINTTVKGKYYAYKAVKAAKENGVNWAMLTNGHKWRLYNVRNISPYEHYIEVDVKSCIEEYPKINEAFYFLDLFFNVRSYFTKDGELIIEKIKDKSDKEAEYIEEFLRGKSEEILKDLCFGLKEDIDKLNYTEDDRKNIYNDSIILLYRLLFLGYAESRSLLPIRKDDPNYTYSFEKLCFDAKEILNSGQLPFIKDGYDFWERLDSNLRQYVDSSYNGGLFHNDDKPILVNHKISNQYLVKCLSEISYNQDKSGKYTSKIEYKDLSVRNLGVIYEGLLEYRLYIAEDRIVQRRNKNKIIYTRASEINLKNSDYKNIIEVGGIYLSQDAIERKETGAYYTPEDVVEYIVKNTVGKKMCEVRKELTQILERCYKDFRYERTGSNMKLIQESIDRITEDFINEKILKLSIIDSAMGSGHFLVNATYSMANEIVSIIEDNDWQSANEIVVDVREWKRRVVEKCIYGIDINELSVALAKLSLWLISADNSKALSFLDHNLKTGDSIVGITKSQVNTSVEIKTGKAFDILPESSLVSILQKYNKINEVGSSNKHNVEVQKKVYEEIEEELYLIKRKFDYYLATKFISSIENKENKYEYNYFMRYGAASDLKKTSISTLMQFAEKNRFFHWELEFPQVFANGGFDVIIGNPPYVDVPMEKYKHGVITNLDTTNLYSYMIDNNLKFANETFEMGYVVPLSLISSNRMKSIREYIVNKGYSEVNLLNIDSSTHPGTLFNNLVLRLTVITISNNKFKDCNQIKTTNYIKFYSKDRKYIFSNAKYINIDKNVMIDGIIPKISHNIEKRILLKILSKTNKNISNFISNNKSNNLLYYRRLGMTYYGYAFDEPPFFRINGIQQNSSTLKTINLKEEISKHTAICIFYSSLFYWFWTVFSDCYNFTRNDLYRLPIDFDELSEFNNKFDEIYKEIIKSLYENGEKVQYKKANGLTEYFLFRPRYSKDIFDKVDWVLGQYYGLDDDEINYLINYDIKFRDSEQEKESELE